MSSAYASTQDAAANSAAPLSASSIPSSANVTIPRTIPTTNISNTLDPRLLSLSIEQCFFLDWSGDPKKPNSLTVNLLSNIASRAGVPPAIRVGGNTEDRTTYDPSVNTIVNVFPPPTLQQPAPEASSVRIGSGFYQAFKNLPNVTYTIGLDFLMNNYSIALQEAQVAYSILNGHGLELIELGNEVDLYKSTSRSPWSPTLYVQQWNEWTQNISKVVPFGKILQIGAIGASPSQARGNDPFTASQILTDGINLSKAKTFSDHFYAQSACSASALLQVSVQRLMSHSVIVANLQQYSIDVQNVRNKGLNFYIGEGNSVVCHGADGVSNAHAAAIWAIDHVLRGAVVGITRFYMHNGRNFFYNVFQGNSSVQQVAPLYYSYLLVAEAIGKHKTQVAELQTHPSSDNIVAYGMYESSILKRLVIINSFVWNSTSTGTRPGTRFAFAQNGTLHRLTAPGMDSKTETTWAHQSYSSGVPTGTHRTEYWSGHFYVYAAEAVIVTL